MKLPRFYDKLIQSFLFNTSLIYRYEIYFTNEVTVMNFLQLL